MTARRSLIALATLALSALPFAASASKLPGFGFNYWPQGYAGCEALTNANWPDAQKKIAADLGLMKSMGADTVRLTFWPNSSGFNGGWRPDSAAACPKLPQLLQTVRDSGFKAIVVFSNTYVLKDANGVEYWKGVYPGGSGSDYSQFLSDSVNWANGLIDMAQASDAADAVLYYDLQNEYDVRLDQIDYYFRTMYQWSHVPATKRGLSILRTPQDIDPANWKSVPTQLQVLGQGGASPGTLAFVEYHSYPVVPRDRCPLHPDIEQVRSQMQTRLPSSTIVLGEFGRRAIRAPNADNTVGVDCGSGSRANLQQAWDEAGQQATELDLISRAKLMGNTRYLHWMLWDNTPPDGRAPTDSDAQVYGQGYTPTQPKDVIGAIGANYGVVPNADMEASVGGAPAQWSTSQWHASSPSQPLSLFVSGGPTSTDAATGSYYARLQTPSACNDGCTIWMQSQTFAIPPGSTQVSVNAFVRSNLSNVHINLVQLNASGQPLSAQYVLQGPQIQTPTSTWPSWYNYLASAHLTTGLDASRSWRFTLAPGATHAYITIGGTPTVAPGILDVDTVTSSVD